MRRSHDSSYPQTAPDGARFRSENRYGKTNSAHGAGAADPRPRVDYHSADCVTLRMLEAGRQAGLQGAVGEVLDAVIALLPQWKRIRDNRIRLHQLISLCPSRPHQRTIGRALRRLAELDIVHYEPACGRGATALIAVHERFLHGVEELERDESGSVVVPFSRPYTSLFPKGKVPQQPAQGTSPKQTPESRPIEVPVDHSELQQVIDQLPPLFSELPRNLQWLLRCAMRTKLARGHMPEEILRILQAPAPNGVQRPFKLAIWRLSQNMLGAGPRLRPFQRAWDRAHKVQQEQERDSELAEDYQRVEAVTTVEQREQLVVAMAALFGPAADSRAAVLTAVRRARRQYPDVPVAAAVSAWLDNGDRRLTPRAAVQPAGFCAVSGEGLRSITDLLNSASCIGCGNAGEVRPELPLPTVVCDGCLAAAMTAEQDQSWAAAS